MPPAYCTSCGAAASAEALYCGSCGTPLGRPPQKTLGQRLPWILSGLALVAFAIAISLMLRGETGERAPGMPPTGGIIQGESEGAPAAVDLSRMSPRESADRLFERTMREESAGNADQARFFAEMAIQAYAMVPEGGLDPDARFHLGLLELLRDDPVAASAQAAAVLAGAPDHLLGLMVSADAAEGMGDITAAAAAQARFLEVLPAQLALGLDEYVQHRGIIDEKSAVFRAQR